MINTVDDLLMVSPLPHRLGLHKNNTKAHLIYKRSTRYPDILRRALEKEDRADHWCGVKGEINELRSE